MSKAEEVEAKLIAAMEARRADGYRVAPGTWGVSADFDEEDDDGDPAGTSVWEADLPPELGCLCPMACVILGSETETCDPEGTAAYMLGITEGQVANFVVGFDAGEKVVPFDQDEFYELGKKFRAEYWPELGK